VLLAYLSEYVHLRLLGLGHRVEAFLTGEGSRAGKVYCLVHLSSKALGPYMCGSCPRALRPREVGVERGLRPLVSIRVPGRVRLGFRPDRALETLNRLCRPPRLGPDFHAGPKAFPRGLRVWVTYFDPGTPTAREGQPG